MQYSCEQENSSFSMHLGAWHSRHESQLLQQPFLKQIHVIFFMIFDLQFIFLAGFPDSKTWDNLN